jgi:hypothetical protein
VSHGEPVGRFAFMAEGKKSFILYCDQRGIFDKLPDEYAGRLIKHIFAYVNDEDPETDDLVITMAFEGIKTALKRDLEKYRQYIEKQRVNGKSGGRPKKANESQKTQAFLDKPKKADSDNVSDSVNENEKKKKDGVYTPEFLKFWNIYPRKEAKPDAFKAFKKIKADELDKILRHVPMFCHGKEPQFIPHPASYLNKRRWEDEQTKTVQPLINRRIITADTEL